MGEEKIILSAVESWAGTVQNRNNELINRLHEIKNLINGLQGDWESDSAEEIRRKITGMEPRFEQYYNVVDNYVKFLRNTAAEYRATEQTNRSNAEQFI